MMRNKVSLEKQCSFQWRTSQSRWKLCPNAMTPKSVAINTLSKCNDTKQVSRGKKQFANAMTQNKSVAKNSVHFNDAQACPNAMTPKSVEIQAMSKCNDAKQVSRKKQCPKCKDAQVSLEKAAVSCSTTGVFLYSHLRKINEPCWRFENKLILMKVQYSTRGK